MRSRIFCPVALLCCIAAPSIALSQAPSAQPAAPAQPAQPTAPAAAPTQPAPQPAQPAAPPPAATPESAPSAAPTAPPAEPPAQPGPPPPPPTYPSGAPVEEPPPPPPTYQPLGGRPEPEIEKGDWDPWDHPTPNTHNHDGFYLRLAIGFGGSFISGNNSDFVGDVDLSGLGLGTSIGIGGALTENLILNADLFSATVFDSTVKQNGRRIGDASDVGNALAVGEDQQLLGFGVGVTYYIMPVNVYLAGSVGLGQVVFEGIDGDRDSSDLGFGANVMVGKEWWVGTDWGIGVAGQLIFVSVGDDLLNHVNGLATTLMFSATYN
jgi:hypothetical protein